MTTLQHLTGKAITEEDRPLANVRARIHFRAANGEPATVAAVNDAGVYIYRGSNLTNIPWAELLALTALT